MKAARPSEILRSQQEVIRQQEELIELLKGALAASGVTNSPTYSAWMSGLARQERALVGILFSSYPRAMSREAIMEVLPSQDHARERQLQIVDAVVHKLRRKLGRDVVVTQRGEGFRLGEAFQAQLRAIGAGVA